jgi:acetyl esterase/lipase
MDFEGANVARWLQSRGVTGVVLRYRLPKNGYRHPVPLQDIQRAVRTLRARAQELHVDPKRVGIMGFSAGGHLVTTLSTHNDDGNPAATDPVEKLGSRPDFCIAVYPVISLDEAITHKVSRLNLLGPNPDPTLVEDLCNEKRVNPRTPPTMLIHSADDKGVPVDNSLRYFAALRAASIPAELHVFDTGGHGFGLGRPVDKAPKDWLVPLESWMRRHGWMP